MQLTRERAITLHRRMWRWIGLKTLKEKSLVDKHEWFNKFELERIKSLCYCCEYAQQIADNSSLSCKACPVDWGVRTCTAPGRGDCMTCGVTQSKIEIGRKPESLRYR